MKRKLRRLLSLLLAVCIVLSLITGMLLTVSAVGENAIRNWGVRDTVCTQLSASALSYYTGNYTYASLKALSGASSSSLSNSLNAAQNNQLYTALYTLMSSTHDSAAISGITYSSHSSWYAYTDCENGDTSGKMKLLWAGGYRTWDGTYVNREHVWCKSHATYVETQGGADLHHLRPASAYVNQQPHNNRPYGPANANGGSTTQDENNNFGGWYLNATTNYPDGLYEPPDNAKGDCARIILYVYTRWKQPNLYTSLDTSSSAYLNFVDQTPEGTCDGTYCIDSLSTLLSWCEMDPVDTWEMGRNDSVQSIQGNRNVFIDYPELAWYMFGMTPPSTMTTPSGDAGNNGVSYSVTNVNVNNSSYGTATITNSNTVTVTPAAGCYIQSATSTSGTCTVTGNVITVNGLTANATVSVVLARNASYTVSFTVPSGVTQASMSGYANDSITLPTPSGTPTANAHNYEFYGWVSAAVNDTTTQPTYYAPGSSYTITGNATLIALYRYTENTGSGATDFDPSGQGGTFVLAANVGGTYYALPVSSLGTARPAGASITVTNGAVTAANASGYEWSLTPNGTGFTISNNGTYLTYSNNSTSLSSSSDSSTTTWAISNITDTSTWQIIPSNNTGSSARSLIYRTSTYNTFAAYSATNVNNTEYYALEILPIGSGAATQTYYTTNLTSTCSHNYGSAVSAGSAGHTYTCTICGDSYTEAHNYTTSVNGLTTTYTCTVCGYSYQETLNSYTISYNVRGTVTSTDTVTEGNSVSLPTAPAYTGYTFVGWATNAINSETQNVPTILTGSYTPTASISLYAVYSRLDQGGGSSNIYELASGIADGDRVVIYNPGKQKAIYNGATLNNYYMTTASVTISNSAITNPDSNIVWDVSYDGTVYTFSNGINKITAGQSGNYMEVTNSTTAWPTSDYTWVLTPSGSGNQFYINSPTVTYTYSSSTYTGYLECYNRTVNNVNDDYICGYGSSAGPSVTNFGFEFYKQGTADATYYTTQPTVLCEHSSTTLTGVTAATCTSAGYTGDYVCDSCGAVVTAGSVIPALSHDYTSAVTTPATCGAAGVRTYTCSRCGDSYTEAIPATGNHSYNNGVQTTAPTCTAAGVTTFTCTVCGDTYTQPIAATGHSYGAFVSNNNGTHTQTCSVCGDTVTNSCTYTNSLHGDQLTHTCNICGYSYTETLSTWTVTFVNCNVSSAVECVDGNSIEFPSSDDVSIDGTDYTFVGWVANKVSETTSRPSTIHTAGESYTPGRSMTYYALYSSSTDGTPYEEFRLVTSTSELAAGDEVVIAARSAAYAVQQNGTTISRTSVSKSNNNANLTVNSATVYTLENNTTVSGAWSFKTGNYYFCVSRNSITGSTSSGYPGAWTISSIDSSNGGAVMSAKRSSSEQVKYLRYSSNSFSTTNSSTNTICLYKKYITTPQVTSYTTELEAHVHQYTTEVTTAATCTSAGVMTYTCSCGDSYTEVIAALGHNYVEHAAQAATCTAAGWNAYQTCTRCDYTTYQAIPALGHNIVADAAVAATCTESGLTAGEHCTRCDYAVAQAVIPALGHELISHDAQAATCTDVGWSAYQTCTRCDYTTYQELPALGHNMVADAAVAATCTESGLTAGEHCTRCDYAVAQTVVPALGHNIVADAAVAATCTESGLTAGEHCTRCDYALAQTVVPALGHSFTYTDDGNGTTHTVGCSRCDYSATENHSFTEDICSLCGAAKPVEATLKLVSAAPVLNDKIDMIYAAEVPEGYSDPYVIFTFHNVETTVADYTTDEYGRLNFVFTDINPQCMGDNISATLYATMNGALENVSVSNYSVRQYCVNMLADGQPTPLRALLSNLLAYGAAAQNYMNYKTYALVTDGSDIVDPLYYDFSDYAPLSGYDASFEGAAAADVYWTSASLTLTNSVAMNFRFYAESTANLSVTVSVNGRTQTFTQFTAISDGVYEVSFTGIAADEFSEGVTASFARSGSSVGNALTYSVNAYVQSKQTDSNAALQALVKALYNYGVAAEAFGGYVG